VCDTFVALPPFTADGSIIFGKNSDREPNEAQVLEYHPARTYPPAARLQCTYLEIPQVRETLAVLLARPFWMWGAEMGANEKGLVIGNEAVWTKMPLNRSGGLTGMDLLRLALERSAGAEAAVETIAGLLSDYGPGGICGYEDKRFAYHNSFILADPKEAWVLETAGPLWAALRVRDAYAVSNGLSIGEEFDRGHPALIDLARRTKWLKKGETFNFSKVYADWFYTTFSGSTRRLRRSIQILEADKGNFDPPVAFNLLRDHGQADYRPDSHFFLDRLCAHAANRLTRNAAQTTGSLVAHLKPDLQTYWVTASSAPCLSVFKPIWLEGPVLPDLGPPPDGNFNPQNFWWRHEVLHRSVLRDFPTRGRVLAKERDAVEIVLLKLAEESEPAGRWPLTRAAFHQAWELTDAWTRRVRETPVQNRPGLTFRRYWQRQNKKAGLQVD